MLRIKKVIHITVFIGLMLKLSACQMGGPQHLEPLPPIDYILIEKSKRTIRVFHQDQELRKYRISLSKNPVGHKVHEGDHRTPEGIYSISNKKSKYKYHRALAISYPNAKDCQVAAKLGRSPGGGVQIHGYEPKYAWVQQHHELLDATRGCILLTNPEMEQIFNATKVGTKIEIKP